MSYPADWKSIAAGPRQLNRGRGAGHSPFQRRYNRLPCTQWQNQILELGNFQLHTICVCVSLVSKVSITTGLRQSISLWWATEGCSDGSGWVGSDGGVMEKVQRRRRRRKKRVALLPHVNGSRIFGGSQQDVGWAIPQRHYFVRIGFSRHGFSSSQSKISQLCGGGGGGGGTQIYTKQLVKHTHIHLRENQCPATAIFISECSQNRTEAKLFNSHRKTWPKKIIISF